VTFVRTIFKDVSPKDLGITHVHEHLVSHPPLWKVKEDPDLLIDDAGKGAMELKNFYISGGRTLVECTAIDYGRDINALIKIAEQVPEVNLIVVTGFNLGSYYPTWVYKKSLDELVDLLVTEVLKGIEGTRARAGVIKIGTSYNHIMQVEEKTLRAGAKAHIETGAPIISHTSLGTMAHEQIEILKEEGVDLGKVAFSHIDHNLDYWYQRKIAETGAYLVYDCIGKIKYYPDEWRINLMKKLIKTGYAENILISGDMARRSYFKSYGGGPGLGFIITKFIPRLREEGFSRELIDKIFIENPARYLAFK